MTDNDEFDQTTGALLDQLGRDAVAEAGSAPEPRRTPETSSRPRTRLLVAAAVVLLVAASAGLIVATVGRDRDTDVVAAPSTSVVDGRGNEAEPLTTSPPDDAEPEVIDLSGGLGMDVGQQAGPGEDRDPGTELGVVSWPVGVDRVVGVEGGRRLGLVLRSDCNRPPTSLQLDRTDDGGALTVLARQFFVIDCVGDSSEWSVIVDVERPLPRSLTVTSLDGSSRTVQLAPADTEQRTDVLATTGDVGVPDRLTPLAARFYMPWSPAALNDPPAGQDLLFSTGELCTTQVAVLRYSVGADGAGADPAGAGHVDGVNAAAGLPTGTTPGSEPNGDLSGTCPLPLELRPA